MSNYTPSQIRAAIYCAADKIERDPKSYHFMAFTKPKSDGGSDCGCMWAWIGFYIGSEEDMCDWIAADVLDNKLSPWNAARHLYVFVEDIVGYSYEERAAGIPSALRAYADRYFPAEKAPTIDPAYEAFRRALLGAPHEQLRLTHQPARVEERS